MKTERVGQSVDWHRRIGLDTPIARLMDARRGSHERLGIREFGQQSKFVRGQAIHDSCSECSTISRISKIEITGSNRINKNISATNNPMEPKSVDQSQNVGMYMPHDDGR